MSEDSDSPGAISPRAKSVESLAQYLSRALAEGAQLEVFLCWEGDQNAEPIARKLLTAKDFQAPVFPLGEKEFAVVGA